MATLWPITLTIRIRVPVGAVRRKSVRISEVIFYQPSAIPHARYGGISKGTAHTQTQVEGGHYRYSVPQNSRGYEAFSLKRDGLVIITRNHRSEYGCWSLSPSNM